VKWDYCLGGVRELNLSTLHLSFLFLEKERGFVLGFVECGRLGKDMNLKEE
jgi:hypothetical protein